MCINIIFADEKQKNKDMRVFLNDSLCKKCPYGGFVKCFYKDFLFRTLTSPKGVFKMVHKCNHYKKIFRKGQVVLVDLHHKKLQPHGKWEYVLAYRNVPGIIRGTRGCKYKVELFDRYFLTRKRKGRYGQERTRLFWQASKNAKDIRPLNINRPLLEHMKELNVTDNPETVVFN